MTTPEPDAPKPTVWILGAGFSKGLGGPLIKDLLAHREKEVLDSLYPSTEYPLVADEVFKARLFYNWGQKRGYWENAEQFLDIVESAAAETHVPLSYAHSLLSSMRRRTVHHPEMEQRVQGSGRVREVIQAPGPVFEFETLTEMATACRRALAVDCSVFLRAAQLESERWSPYRDWARSLGPRDTVVTFNYDHVPEILETDLKNHLSVIDPEDVDDDLEEVKTKRMTPVLKVHGSVTWRRDGKRIKVVPLGDRAIGDPREDPVIGLPGPGKRTLVRDVLKALWKAALHAIENAGHLIFVGYRFPPTDADSRTDLLSTLSQNRFRGQGPSVHTVLGPDVNSPDSTRLMRLLEASTRGPLKAVPLFAEDYIGLHHLLDL